MSLPWSTPEGPRLEPATQIEAEEGTSKTLRLWTPTRIKQAIQSLSPQPADVQTSAPANPEVGRFWFDTDEAAVASNEGISKTLVDAKGDILLGSANDTVVRRAAPANGKLLVGDSSSADGWREPVWASVNTDDSFSAINLSPVGDYSTTTPNAPLFGLTLFTRFRARRIPAFIGPTGQDSALQPALFSNRVARLTVVNNVAAPQFEGLAVTNRAAPTAVANAATNFYTSMVRARYSSTATAGNAGGFRSTTAQWFRSDTANMGGFFAVIRFGLNAVTATNRLFLGFSTTTTDLAAGLDPSGYLNMVGFAANAAHTTFRFMHNDGVGGATQIDLGANFPCNVAATNFYEFRIFCPSGSGGTIHYSAHRLNDGQVVQGSVSTDLPALNTLLSWHTMHSNGTTAAAASIDVQSLYIETDN